MIIKRTLFEPVLRDLQQSKKAIILYGARQVGKTTLSREIIAQTGLRTLAINADEGKYIDILSSRDSIKLRSLVEGYDVFFLDEAQRVPNIGINLKILIDQFPALKIIVTGSSSFDLANKIAEPLTGRVRTHILYPISLEELRVLHTPLELREQLEELLVFGSYPDVLQQKNWKEKQITLEGLTQAYLYKDIFELTSIKHSHKIRDLLKLLAFQIGQEVSVTELGTLLDMGKDTVAHYIDLLEQSFIIFRLSGLSRNLRKEVRKMDKIYFCDLGIRNIMIDNCKPLKERNDVGALWENFLIVERRKALEYAGTLHTSYFWRTHTGAELDYVEERDGSLFGYEIKYGSKKVSAPKSWMETYTNANFQLINQENFLEFVIPYKKSST